ncbi:MAG: hypothetical protein J7K87_00725 [Candidatus Aenigmarchaeota archaeon]|nr:hypothetical protein [Candidatus Aenigmarchaeota archaeon]
MNFDEAISIIFSAPAIAIYVVIIFSLFSPIGLGRMGIIESLMVGILFLSIIPIGVIFAVVGNLTGWNVFDRRKRNKIYPFVIVSYVIGAGVFWFYNNHIMFMISLSYIFVTLSLMFINFFWKISAHTAGVAGPVTALAYVFGWSLAFLYIFIPLVAYSRKRLGSHDFNQLLAGTLIAIFITILIYFIWW